MNAAVATSYHFVIRSFIQCTLNSPTHREGTTAPLEQHRLPRESAGRVLGGGGGVGDGVGGGVGVGVGGGGGGSGISDGAASATLHQPPHAPPAPLLRRVVLDVGRGRCRITNGTQEVRLVTGGSNFSEAAIELSKKEKQQLHVLSNAKGVTGRPQVRGSCVRPCPNCSCACNVRVSPTVP